MPYDMFVLAAQDVFCVAVMADTCQAVQQTPA